MDSTLLLIERQEGLIADLSHVLPALKATGRINKEVALRRRVLQVEQLRTEFRRRDAEIQITSSQELRDSNPYFKLNKVKAFREGAEDLLDEIDEILASLSQPKSTGEAPRGSQVTEIQPTVPLPRMDIPRFDGVLEEWPSFRDRITSLILKNKRLTDDQRMHYLVTSLKGEPFNAIRHLDVCSINLTIAWQILERQYENERELVFANIKKLLALPSIEPASYTGLRAMQDTVNTVLHTMRKLDRDPDQWNDLLVYILTDRLDAPSREAWETTIGSSKKVPTYKQFDEFLEARVRILQSMSTSPPSKALPTDSAGVQSDSSKSKKETKRVASLAVVRKPPSCVICSQSHYIFSCPDFAKLTLDQRIATMKQAKRCLNCFGKGHFSDKCTSKYRCKQCKAKHHSLLHSDKTREESKPQSTEPLKVVEVSSNSVSRIHTATNKLIMLATARVNCHSSRGRMVTVRALLDQGSEATLISENLVQLLRLPRRRDITRVRGASETTFLANGTSKFGLSHVSSFSPSIQADGIIVKSVIHRPTQTVSSLPNFPQLEGLSLADPDPLNDDTVDLLIGADLYSSVFLDGIRRGKSNEPMAQQTIFGWILTGPLIQGPIAATVRTHLLSISPLQTMMTRFWELEEVPTSQPRTKDEDDCEEHFINTHSRTSEGRYVVRFPFKTTSPPHFQDSRASALSQLKRLERRLERDADTALEYHQFLHDYERLGHMEAVEENSPSNDKTVFYIPHHAVVRESSQTTRLRVVFNASARDSAGGSLNESLHPGPRLQLDLAAILLRWRQHQYVLTADVEKMFRQILIHPSETDYQRILWRASPSHPVVTYRLLTVTYGTTSAPYQSIRVLNQLAEDEGTRFPHAVDVIKQQTYVDDCLFGADDIETTRSTRDQTIELLRSGGFRLRKWASNDQALLTDINQDDHGIAHKDLKWDDTLKILGLKWNPLQDVFQVHLTKPDCNNPTKRSILSIIARLFDPLGWLAPVIITAKILLQEIWKTNCDWDESLPESIQIQWNSFVRLLPKLEEIQIPRWTATRPHTHLEIHGFTDASTAAYAAVVYLRVTTPSKSTTISLIIAKTKVAPLKTLSIPRLELCAAVLLTRLMRFTRSSLGLEEAESYCWSDSTVALAWLRQSPSKWKPFVAHRVSQIQEFSGRVTWRYVPTSQNPADCASRGIQPNELSPHPLWWTGPPWLTLSTDHWPNISPQVDDEVTIESRRVRQVHAVVTTQIWSLQNRYSSWTRLIRITAILIKWSHRLKGTTETPIFPLLSPDLARARTHWIAVVQRELFPEELAILSQSGSLSRKNPLSSFTPFLDEDGILRARGRLIHAPLLPAAKHPIILRSHPLVRLIILEKHLQMLHGDLQLTLSSLRQRYWILRARPLIRSVLSQCVKCARERAQPASQLMGDLPAFRVTRSARAFEHTGLDYAGPLLVRLSPGRGSKSRKAYISLFICMTTRAIHLELVSDCSANAFIASYQRFTSRRGIPSDLYSDNSTTFHGAERQLSALFKSSIHEMRLADLAADSGTKWHFIPPAAPHFGGLWEAAVRSVKHHLKRCTSTALLTSEELHTLLCKIEACLNSRPLVAMSDCIEDYQCLTPGHFLIGQAITAHPEPSLLDENENRLNRWQRIHRLTEQFWTAWRKDYVHTLQQRPKWRHVQKLAREGRMVFLHDPALPPSHWSLARIIACHPGEDGFTRVVTVKTQHSTLKRPLTKLTFLPDDINSVTDAQSGMAGGKDGASAPQRDH